MGNFAKCLAPTRKWEGGNDDDKDDPGARTSRGIIQTEYDEYRDAKGLPRGDVWQASEDEIREIYHTNYWQRVRGDELDDGIAMFLFDTAVNNGVGACAKIVQRALGPLYTGIIDTDFGPKTFAGLKKVKDNDALIGEMAKRRQWLFNAIAERRPASKKFLQGWTNRNNDIRAVAQAWATGSVGPEPTAEAGTVPAPKAKPPAPPAEKPLSQSKTIWGLVVAAFATLGSRAEALAQKVEGLLPYAPWLGTAFVLLTIVGLVWAAYGRVDLRQRARAEI